MLFLEKRESGLDLLRVVALLFVVTFHSYLNNGYYYEAQMGIPMLLAGSFRWLSTCCVGLFLMLTGYLKSDRTGIKDCYRALVPVFLGYLIAAAISIPVRHFVFGDRQSLAIWLKRLFGFSAVYYGWYVGMYLGLTMLSPFLDLLASAAIPLWLLGRKHALSPIQRSLLCLLLFLYPAYSGSAAYDLHENAFLTPLLFWLFYAMDCGSGWRVSLFAALTLMVKEDAAVYVAVAGLYLTARSLRKPCDRKGVKTGLLLLLASVGWFFAVTTYLFRCGDGVMAYRYENFMPEGTSSLVSVMKTVLLLPMKVLYECVETEKLEFLALTLMPLLGLPFLTRQYERFLLLIPYVLVNLMSDYPYQHDIYFQYTFGATAFLFYLTLLNLSELMCAFPKPVFLSRLPLFLALLTALGCFYPSSLGRGAFYIKLYDTNRTSYAQIDGFLQAVPNETSVAATTFYTTALSNREVLYDIKYASTEHLLCAEYILLDPTDTASYQKYGGLADFIRFLQAHGYTETDGLGELLLLFQKETRAETRVP